MDGHDLLIYGATGYTGRLAAAEAVRRGLAPVLAGRDEAAVGALAASLGVPHRAFGLDDPEAIRAGLAGARAMLHCAGPFVRTARPMQSACLGASAGYLDITGEIPVFERTIALDARARAAGVAFVSGVGFDVVPTDCLAALLAEALPDATHLDLAFTSRGGSWSAGTVKTMIESFPYACAARRNGKIVPRPLAAERLDVDFPFGRRRCAAIAWGDVSTAFHTTGIPNIRTFAAFPPAQLRLLTALRYLLPLAGVRPVKRLLQRLAGRAVAGPDEAAHAHARSFAWGRAWNDAGEAVVGTIETPEAYAFTAVAAVECAVRLLAGRVAPGAWTPARAFGPGLAGELPGVVVGPVRRA